MLKLSFPVFLLDLIIEYLFFIEPFSLTLILDSSLFDKSLLFDETMSLDIISLDIIKSNVLSSTISLFLEKNKCFANG